MDVTSICNILKVLVVLLNFSVRKKKPYWLLTETLAHNVKKISTQKPSLLAKWQLF